jgi:hypothetical protein
MSPRRWYIVAGEASRLRCQPLSVLKFQVEFDLVLYPSRPEKYQDNDQQQEDHRLTLLSAP